MMIHAAKTNPASSAHAANTHCATVIVAGSPSNTERPPGSTSYMGYRRHRRLGVLEIRHEPGFKLCRCMGGRGCGMLLFHPPHFPRHLPPLPLGWKPVPWNPPPFPQPFPPPFPTPVVPGTFRGTAIIRLYQGVGWGGQLP